MKLALDTNAYRARVENERTLIHASRQAEVIGLPIVVLGELRFGFLNGTKLEDNERILATFLNGQRVRVLHLNEETTRLFGETAAILRRQGISLSQNDIWIAAICKQQGFTLATRDRDFHRVFGLQVLEV